MEGLDVSWADSDPETTKVCIPEEPVPVGGVDRLGHQDFAMPSRSGHSALVVVVELARVSLRTVKELSRTLGPGVLDRRLHDPSPPRSK